MILHSGEKLRNKPMKMLFGLAAVMLLMFPSTAEAYVDASTGSLLVQLLLGGFAGAAVVVRLLWHRCFKRPDPDEDDSASS